VFNVKFVDFYIERRIAFSFSNGVSVLLPLVEGVNVTADLKFAVMCRAKPMMMATDLNRKFP